MVKTEMVVSCNRFDITKKKCIICYNIRTVDGKTKLIDRIIKIIFTFFGIMAILFSFSDQMTIAKICEITFYFIIVFYVIFLIHYLWKLKRLTKCFDALLKEDPD